MTNAIIKNTDFFKLLCSTNSDEQRQALLDTATPSQVRAFCEIVFNLYKKRCKSPQDKESIDLLEEFDPVLRRLSAINRPFGRKKRLLIEAHKQEVNQKGAGLFSVLLPLLGTIISTAVSS